MSSKSVNRGNYERNSIYVDHEIHKRREGGIRVGRERAENEFFARNSNGFHNQKVGWLVIMEPGDTSSLQDFFNHR